MSATAEFQQIARAYEAEADRFPDGSHGRVANLAEAAKYRDLAARAQTWPTPTRTETSDD